MLQLHNKTPFQATILVLPDAAAVDTLYVVVKATFSLASGRDLEVSPEQRPITLADEYHGEPGISSLKAASEAHLEKPGTDVLIVAEACAHDERPIPVVDVGVSVAGRQQLARVFGDRYWDKGLTALKPSAPRPFVRMPLIYERAFGGTHAESPQSDRVVAHPDNPVGSGFRGKRNDKELLGQPVPNINSVREPLEKPANKGEPLGFGPIAPTWGPRVGYAGTYDDTWQKTRAPYLPEDFDARFFNAAHPHWVFPKGLEGGEPIVSLNLIPEGRQRLNLPRCSMDVQVGFDSRRENPRPALETVLLAPTDGYLCMTWRAAVPCDKETVREVDIEVEALELGTVGS